MIYFLSICLRFLIKVLKGSIPKRIKIWRYQPSLLKNIKHEKENYRPVSITSVTSRILGTFVFMIKSIKALRMHCRNIRWAAERV